MSDTPDDSISPMLGRVPSGIYILTVRHGEQETGMLASWVVQSGFEPPAVTVAVKKGRYITEWLDAGAPFALNVVSESGIGLLAQFGRGFEPGEPAFEGLEVDRSENDVPLLTEGTVGYLLCHCTGHIDSGDHRIFCAEVIDGELRNEETPMVHIRKSGAHY